MDGSSLVIPVALYLGSGKREASLLNSHTEGAGSDALACTPCTSGILIGARLPLPSIAVALTACSLKSLDSVLGLAVGLKVCGIPAALHQDMQRTCLAFCTNLWFRTLEPWVGIHCFGVTALGSH